MELAIISFLFVIAAMMTAGFVLLSKQMEDMDRRNCKQHDELLNEMRSVKTRVANLESKVGV